MQQTPIQIGATVYYVNRKYAGDRHPKELILNKIIDPLPNNTLDKKPRSEV